MLRTSHGGSDNLPHVSRRVEDSRYGRKSEGMVQRDNKGINPSDISTRFNMADNHVGKRTIQPAARVSKFLEHIRLNQGKLFPLAVLLIPSAFLTGCSMEASASTLSAISDTLQHAGNWFEALNAAAKEDVLNPKSQMKEFMVWLYKTISMIIYTPVFLFDNEFFRHMIRVFSGLSIAVVSVASMLEGFKKVLGWSGTPLRQIVIRLPILIAVCGFAPYGFVKAIEVMNGITNMFLGMGTKFLSSSTYSTYEEFSLINDAFEVIGLFLFILLYIALLIPMLLNHGRRWFNMIALGVLTPFAMLGYIFDSFKSLHHSWWNSLKGLFLVQIVYSIYVTILSLLMFAVPFPTTIEGFFAKLLVILGGLYMMAIPPTSVKKYFDHGPTPKQSYAVVAQKLGKLMLRRV